jgi:hypothetical protein
VKLTGTDEIDDRNEQYYIDESTFMKSTTKGKLHMNEKGQFQ